MNDAATAVALDTEHFRQRGIIQQHGAFLVRLGAIVDSAIIVSALYLLVRQLGPRWDERYLTVAVCGVFLFQTLASFFNLYRSLRIIRLREELLDILLAWTGTAALITGGLFVFVSNGWNADRRILLYWYLASFAGIAGFRVVMRLSLRHYRAFGHDHRAIAFVGATETARRLAHTFQTHAWMGMDVIGCYDDDIKRLVDEGVSSRPPLSANGQIHELIALAERGEVNAIYITLPMAEERRIKTIIGRFAGTTVSVYYCPNLFEFDLLNARWDDIFGQPVISVVESPFGGYERYLKRIEDLMLVMLILPLALLPLGIIAVVVKLSSPGPVLYAQKRYGLNGRVFKIWKFRTMHVVEDEHEFVQATRGDARITSVGRWLRRTSLDELPQILNVLRGEMSVVGPRPHPTRLDERHRELIHRYMLRHKVKPGITGWAQVNGCRGETDTLEKMERRIQYDLEYIRGWSLWLDLKILGLTPRRAFRDENAH